ncbi:MAG: hypothetical protein LBU27_06625 [Candidatus Peribacteria bacterium]|nr:hypothetical protein [Candidatus Peribacteria bacterium]
MYISTEGMTDAGLSPQQGATASEEQQALQQNSTRGAGRGAGAGAGGGIGQR